MELVVEPDFYSPSIDESGNYVDKIPTSNIINQGILCPCSSRKAKVYKGYSNFSTHIKTQCHQKWLSSLNANKANYYVENKKLEEIVKQQRLIIAKNEQDLQNKSMTIDYLTQQLLKSHTDKAVGDLLEFD